MSFVNQDMNVLCDNIYKAFLLCKDNQDVWNDDKIEMLKIIKQNLPDFYKDNSRICRSIVNQENIDPLLLMIRTFHLVQLGEITLDQANKHITETLNAAFVDPVLNSEQLVKEREEKQKLELQKNKDKN